MVSKSTVVDAPSGAVWETLAAFDRIGDWFDGVEHASYLTESTEGVGCARRVQVGRNVLVERVTVWEPGRALAYTLEGLPPVVGGATNHWTLVPEGERTRVTLTTTVDPGVKPPGRLVARLLARRLATASDGMLAGLAAHHAGAPSR